MKRPRKRRKSFVGTAMLLGAVVLGGIAVGSACSPPMVESKPSPAVTPTITPSPSHTVSATPSPTAPAPKPIVTPTKETLTSATIGMPSHLSYPAAGIDLPLGAMEEDAGPFVPPKDEARAFWLTKRPGYILAHSYDVRYWPFKEWPFNRLTNHAKVGQIITLTTPKGKVSYKVTSVEFYPKHDLEKDGVTPVWDINDHLLRLIGCKDGDVWQQVTVVTAEIIQ